jgi:hypothetical protein
MNGHWFAIRRNLWNLLVRINHKGQILPIWCDALCIDQNIEATQERNHQVQLMGRIYSAAQSVVVWLGEEADNSAALFDFLNRSTAAGATQRSQTSNQIDSRTFWTSFKRLCQREYWKRVWIVQEVILARKLEILFGDKRMPWATLESACLKPEKMPSIRFAANKACRRSINTSNFGLFIRQRASKQRKSLLELVRVYANSESTDPRDAIYGLIGLASDGQELAVNYSAGIESIYAEVMELCTEEDPSFSILLQRRLGLRKRFNTHNICRGTFVESEIFKIRPLSFSFLSLAYHKWVEVPEASCVYQAVLEYSQLHPQLEIQMTDNFCSRYHDLWPNFTGEDTRQIRTWRFHMENCGVCVDPLGVHLRGKTFCSDGLRIARNVMDIIFKHAMKRMKPDHERSCTQFNFKIWSIYPELCSLFQAANVLSRQPGDAESGPTFKFGICRGSFSCFPPSRYVRTMMRYTRHHDAVDTTRMLRVLTLLSRTVSVLE